MNNYETIRFGIDQSIARLTLHRPEKLNSFTQAMHAEVRDALSVLRESGARVLVLSGAGRAFCAGQDLGERGGEQKADLGESIEKNYAPLVKALRALPMPVIAAVNGVAAGAGTNLALACDLVIAAQSARFVQPFCRLGLMPDAGGTWSLPRLVGLPRALGLVLLGEPLSATHAAQWGLIWQCVEDAEFPAVVEAIAARLAAGPTRGFARTKQAMYVTWENTFEEQLTLERDFQRELGWSADYAEGVAAFTARREPNFRGE